MGSEWPYCRLEKLAASNVGAIAIGPFGSRLKADCYIDEGVGLIRGTNLTGSTYLAGDFVYISEAKASELGHANLKPADLVFPHRGSIGAVGIVPDDGQRYVLSTSLMKISLDHERAVPAFYYYYFRSPQGKGELLKNASQVGTPGIATPLTSLRGCSVPCPSVTDQLNAVRVLSALDERIELLRETNASLEAIVQALFKSWFVDFEPVRAKAEGLTPVGMDADTAALFPSEFEDSALGGIPKGWAAVPLANALEVQIGGAWGEECASAKSTINVSCMRGIDAVDIGAGKMPMVPKRWISQKQVATRTLVEGNILVEGSGSFCGRSLYWIDLYANLLPLTPTYSNFVKRLASPLGKEVAYWASRHLTQIFDSGEVANYRIGSAFPNLDATGLLGKKVAMPMREQIYSAFFELVRPMLSEKTHIIQRTATLADLRDTLLPRLISGKLRLPEAEALIEDAMA